MIQNEYSYIITVLYVHIQTVDLLFIDLYIEHQNAIKYSLLAIYKTCLSTNISLKLGELFWIKTLKEKKERKEEENTFKI